MIVSCPPDEKEAIRRAKQLIHISPKEAPKLLDSHVESYREKGQFGCALQTRRYQCYALMSNLDFVTARTYIERLFMEAREANEPKFVGIGEMYLGIIATENGEIDVASECFDHAIGIATELQDLDLIRRVQVNLGYAQIMMERYQEALETLRLSIGLFDGADADTNAAVAYKNVALATCYLAFHSAVDGKLDPGLLSEARRSVEKARKVCLDDFRLETMTRILNAMVIGMERGPHSGLIELELAKESVFQKNALSVSLSYLATECNLYELAGDWERLAKTSIMLLKHMRKHNSLAQYQTISRQAARAHANLKRYRAAYAILEECSKCLASARTSTGLHGAYITNLRFDLEQKNFGEKVLRLRNRTLSEQNRILEREARFDPLSGVLNRRGIEEAVRDYSMRRSVRSFAIALLDIDLFKKINDRFGHAVGDLAIREFAKCLTESKTFPVKVGRWGGEEFLLVLDANGLEDLERLGETIVEEIRNRSWGNVHPGLKLTASCGLALWSSGGSIDEATKLADEMLYVVKQNGRNGWCVPTRPSAA